MLSQFGHFSPARGIAISLAVAAIQCIAPRADAGTPYISAATHTIQVQLDGIEIGPGGVSFSLIKMGTLRDVSEAKPQAPRDKCPAGQRLTLTGTTMVCHDPKGQLQEWYNKVAAGKTDRKSGSIILLDREGAEVLRSYNFHDCFPTSYKKYEPEDCDDKDDSLVAVELNVGAVEVVSQVSKHNGDYLPAHNFKIEIDGCVSGGTCPGRNSDDVSNASLEVDAAATLPGGASTLLDGVHKLRLKINDSDNDDALCAWMLRAQGDGTVSPTVKCSINTTRSNIKHGKAPAPPGPETRLLLTNVRMSSVELPTIDFSPNPPAADTHIVEEIEFVVEKVERA